MQSGRDGLKHASSHITDRQRHQDLHASCMRDKPELHSPRTAQTYAQVLASRGELEEEGESTMSKTKFIVEPGKQEIIVTREFDAPRDLVFKTYLDPKLQDLNGGGHATSRRTSR